MKSLVWRELLLAGIGEQFSDCVSSPFDDIVGLTVGKRDKEDIIQIWNLDHKYSKNATVCDKLQELVPDVKFSVIFYKGKHFIYSNKTRSKTNTALFQLILFMKRMKANKHQFLRRHQHLRIIITTIIIITTTITIKEGSIMESTIIAIIKISVKRLNS